MKWDISRGVVIAGNVLGILLAALVASLIVYHRLNRSHPLEGGIIAIGTVLGSPLILAFQVFAIAMTKKSDLAGLRRFAAFTLNIIGAGLALLFVLLLVFLWRMGPINPG